MDLRVKAVFHTRLLSFYKKIIYEKLKPAKSRSVDVFHMAQDILSSKWLDNLKIDINDYFCSSLVLPRGCTGSFQSLWSVRSLEIK